MKKNKLFAIIILIISFVMLMGMSATIYADGPTSVLGTEDGDVPSLDDEITDGGVQTPTNPGPTLETPADPEPETQNPGSTYPESTMPNAGLEDSILMVSAFIACAIIGIYTFMKLSEYSNI